MFPKYQIQDFFEAPLKYRGFHIDKLEEIDAKPTKIKSPHLRNFHKLFFLTGGQVKHQVDDTAYVLETGNLLYVDQNELYDWFKSPTDKWQGYRLMFTDDFLLSGVDTHMLFEMLYVHKQSYNTKMTLFKPQKIGLTFDSLLRIYDRERDHAKEIKGQLFNLLKDIKLDIENENARNYTSETLLRYRSFIALVNENYKNNLKLGDYASKMNLSKRQLFRVIKQVSNASLFKIINDRKLIESKMLLTHSKLSILEIAIDLGFSDVTYFTRWFKKYTTQTPKLFRKNVSSIINP